jgi:hypothetical protein
MVRNFKTVGALASLALALGFLPVRGPNRRSDAGDRNISRPGT